MRLQFVFFGLLYTGLFLFVWDIHVGASMCLMYCLNFFAGPFLNPPLVTDQLACLRQRFQEQLGKDSFRRQDNCVKHFYGNNSIVYSKVLLEWSAECWWTWARVHAHVTWNWGAGAEVNLRTWGAHCLLNNDSGTLCICLSSVAGPCSLGPHAIVHIDWHSAAHNSIYVNLFSQTCKNLPLKLWSFCRLRYFVCTCGEICT